MSGVLQTDGRFFLNRAYAEFVFESGGIPLLMTFGQDPISSAKEFCDLVDGILFTGGGDVHPRYYGETIVDADSFCPEEERDAFELELFQCAYQKKLPMFGICRGIQLMAVAKGGSLYQQISGHREGVLHSVTYQNGEEDTVNSYHSQAIKNLPSEAQGFAYSQDGICEGMRFLTHPFAVGVQWHPERQKSAYDRRLFCEFIQACSAFREG